MTAISSGVGAHRSRVGRKVAHSLWRDMVIGLAIAVIVLTMIVLGTRGRSAIQTDGSWPGVETPRPEAPLSLHPSPGLFPRGTRSDYTTL